MVLLVLRLALTREHPTLQLLEFVQRLAVSWATAPSAISRRLSALDRCRESLCLLTEKRAKTTAVLLIDLM